MQKSWFAALAMLGLSSPALANDIMGTWLVADKTAVIKVEPCEPGLCGVLGWANAPATDKNNPDPKLRNRDIIGMRIFTMKPAGQNRWEGEIYNAKDGKTYTGKVALNGADALRIEGCVLGFLCGGETWTRTKCDDQPTATGTTNPQAKRPQSPPKGAAAKGAAAASASVAGLPLTGCRGVAP
jgi:uncharacterized protein (DUF2147 family)